MLYVINLDRRQSKQSNDRASTGMLTKKRNFVIAKWYNALSTVVKLAPSLKITVASQSQ